MKSKLKTTVIASLLGILSEQVHSEAEDPNVTLMKKLYSKIGQTVGVGSNDASVGESFLILANPGILLDPKLDVTTVQGRYRLATLVDKVPRPDWIYKPSDTSIYDVYARMISDHEAAEIKPNAQQKQQYMEACKLIFTDCTEAQPGSYTNGFLKYQDTQKSLATASKLAYDYQTVNHTDDLPPDIANNLEQATTNFNLLGNRVEIEAALSKINTYEHIDPNAYWGEIQGKFSKNSANLPTGAKGASYSFYPSYPVWLDPSQTWTSMTLTQSDIEQTTSNSHTSVGGGVSSGWGPWSTGADYAHQENRSYFKLDATGYVVKLEMMRVGLDRLWFDNAVFSSHAWQWLKGSPYYRKQISEGGDLTNQANQGAVMPFVPTGLLLARKVSLSGGWSNDLKTTFDSHTSGGASIGWGPFSFGGRYDASDSNSYTKANVVGNTISWDAPQIIGFFVEVLPKSPDPDKCYKFPSNEKPLPPECANFKLPFEMEKLDSSALINTAENILSKYKSYQKSKK